MEMIREDRLGNERRLATESAWSVTKDKTDNAPNSSKCVTARSLVQMVSVSQIKFLRSVTPSGFQVSTCILFFMNTVVSLVIRKLHS